MIMVDHPKHYQGKNGEVINVIEDFGLNFNIGNVVKYVCRSGKKSTHTQLEDLEKAKWYLEREISTLRSSMANFDDVAFPQDFKIGDKVFDKITLKHGHVASILKNTPYPLLVRYDGGFGEATFTACGKDFTESNQPSLIKIHNFGGK